MPALKVVCEGEAGGTRFLTSAESLEDLRSTISARLSCRAPDVIVEVEEDGERWEVVDSSGWSAFIKPGTRVYATSKRRAKGKKRAMDDARSQQASPASKKRVQSSAAPATPSDSPRKTKKSKEKEREKHIAASTAPAPAPTGPSTLTPTPTLTPRSATPAAERQSWSLLATEVQRSSRRAWSASENKALWDALKAEVNRLDVLPVTREERVAFYQRILDLHPQHFQGRTPSALESRASTKALEAQRNGVELPDKLLALFPRRTVVVNRRSESASSAASEAGSKGRRSASREDAERVAKSKKKKKDKAADKAGKRGATASSSRPTAIEPPTEISSDGESDDGSPSSAASHTSSTLIDASADLALATEDSAFNPFAAVAPASQLVRTSSSRIAAGVDEAEQRPAATAGPSRAAKTSSQSSASAKAARAPRWDWESFKESVAVLTVGMGSEPSAYSLRGAAKKTLTFLRNRLQDFDSAEERERSFSDMLYILYDALFNKMDQRASARRISCAAAFILCDLRGRINGLDGDGRFKKSLQTLLHRAWYGLPLSQLDALDCPWPAIDLLAALMVYDNHQPSRVAEVTSALLSRPGDGGARLVELTRKVKAVAAYVSRHLSEASSLLPRLRDVTEQLKAATAKLGDPDDKENFIASTCSQLVQDIASQVSNVQAKLASEPRSRLFSVRFLHPLTAQQRSDAMTFWDRRDIRVDWESDSRGAAMTVKDVRGPMSIWDMERLLSSSKGLPGHWTLRFQDADKPVVQGPLSST